MKDCDKHRRMKGRDPRKPFAVLEEIGQASAPFPSGP